MTASAWSRAAARAAAGHEADARRLASPPPRGQLLPALESALAAEHAASYGYGVVGAHLTGAEQAAATRDWIAHQEARDALEAMLTALGAQPQAAATAYRLPRPVLSAHDAVALAVLLEDRVATAYLGLVAVSSPAVRHFGALRLRAAALSAAFWRGTTVAFPGLPADVLGRPPKA